MIKLLNEARGLMGMIAEVQCKAQLLKQRALEEDETLLEEDAEVKLEQMQRDLDTYSDKLQRINFVLQKRLKGAHGNFPHFFGMGNSHLN